MRIWNFLLAGGAVATGLAFLLASPKASSQGEEVVVAVAREPSPAASDLALQKAYDAHLEQLERDASRHSVAPKSTAIDVETGTDCAKGTVFWQRDSITPICVPTCVTDADCGDLDGRCRILDVASEAKVHEIVLVDDVPEEELEVRLEAMDPTTPPMTVCDPFWDFEGALDVDQLD